MAIRNLQQAAPKSRWRALPEPHSGVGVEIEIYGDRVSYAARGTPAALVACGAVRADMIAPGKRGKPRFLPDGSRWFWSRRWRSSTKAWEIYYGFITLAAARLAPGMPPDIEFKSWSPNVVNAPRIDPAPARVIERSQSIRPKPRLVASNGELVQLTRSAARSADAAIKVCAAEAARSLEGVAQLLDSAFRATEPASSQERLLNDVLNRLENEQARIRGVLEASALPAPFDIGVTPAIQARFDGAADLVKRAIEALEDAYQEAVPGSDAETRAQECIEALETQLSGLQWKMTDETRQ